MATKEQDKPESDNKARERERRMTAIGNHVLDGLGEPADFLRIQVRSLWGDYFRVNVFVGVETAFARVAHSFFLTADGEGKILGSSPKLARSYHPVDVAAAS
jgi:hypothetical protein